MQQTQLKEHERLDRINDRLSLIQNTTHLTFGTDALLLAGALPKGERAAELGAGNGVVSLLAASRGNFRRIDGFELQKSASELFERNIALNALEQRVFVENRDIRNIPAEFHGRYDCVFSNPPYMRADTGRHCAVCEKQTARHEMAGGVSDFCLAASALVRYGGEVIFVYRPERICDLVEAMRRAGIEPKRITAVCSDPVHAPSMLLVSGRKGGGMGLFFSPVFYIEDTEGHKTEDYEYLMREGHFHERYLRP